MERFITDCEFKTPAMNVKVFDNSKNLKKEYDVPPGFQLEQYVMSLHPRSSLSIGFVGGDFCIDVYKGKNLVERHVGKYETEF
uniref:Uncharacterized protein n=1 Tax=Marseillevirus LCMAC101 TaxID=2506602 RepID=A0A481YSV8_9VIRU|nr:MAG: hypothetical protein LCMAC101_06320 [Marseillevirus LCMAC101]